MSSTISNQIAKAQRFLECLNFDRERTNERSALVLLALLGLKPKGEWSMAKNELIRTVEIMAWIRSHYKRDYKPNTRETIRRETLHQFVEASLVEQNPDAPDRPVNSPRWCYQLRQEGLELARSYRASLPKARLAAYLIQQPGLRTQYAAERDLLRIPVTLPDGAAFTLSPGGQNVLIKSMVENFCPYFTPGGHVLYVGDADSKWTIFDQQKLALLGVRVDHHGKMPDLVIYQPEKNWLILLEAASSHGPVDSKRHAELSSLFGLSTAGLVFVSCFPSRAEMRKYLAEIAWESEVWCADNPTHLIHFNGDRFLGPH